MFGPGFAPWGGSYDRRSRHRVRGGRSRAGGAVESGRWGGRGSGRSLDSEKLQRLLLELIAQRPRHGYELIHELEMMLGHHAPGPAAVYPTLMLLEERKLLSAASSSGTWGLFAITAEGRRCVAQDALENARSRGRMPPREVRRALRGLRAALMRHRGPWDDGDIARVREIIEEAAAAIPIAAKLSVIKGDGEHD